MSTAHALIADNYPLLEESVNTTDNTLSNVFKVGRRGMFSQFSSTDFRYTGHRNDEISQTRIHFWTLSDDTPVKLITDYFYGSLVMPNVYYCCTLKVGEAEIKIDRIEHHYDFGVHGFPAKSTCTTPLGDLVVELIPDGVHGHSYTYRCTWIGQPLRLNPEHSRGLRCLHYQCNKPVATEQGLCSDGHADDNNGWVPPDNWD